jgi:hypothetical protein
MATPPDFTTGAVLTAAQMNAVGLWEVATLTITNATSGSIDTPFTSDYKNYRVVGTFTSTTAINVALTLRNSGGDVTASNYKYMDALVGYGNTAWTIAGSASTANFPTIARTNDNGAESAVVFDILGPATATRTSVISNQTDQTLYRTMNGIYNADTAMVGFKLSATTAFTGTFRVYGYRN